MVKRVYYNYDKLYSYNAMWMFIVGLRGVGKTYGAKVKAIKAALNKGEEFIYLRRYKPEISNSASTFFSDVAHEFPGYDFKATARYAQYAPIETRGEKKREWYTMGYFFALSSSSATRSMSFPRVKLIIFDEFIVERGATPYLPNEATIFLNFYNTVDRSNDKTKVLFIANSVSIMNPYFIEYRIVPDEGGEFIVPKHYKGYLVAHFVEAAEFASSVYDSKFGQFIQDTEYAAYVVGNTFADNHEGLVASKRYSAVYMFTVECKTGIFSVWYDRKTGDYTIQRGRPKEETIYTLVAEKMSSDKRFVTFTDPQMKILRGAFRSARVFFDEPATRNVFTEIFKR